MEVQRRLEAQIRFQLMGWSFMVLEEKDANLVRTIAVNILKWHRQYSWFLNHPEKTSDHALQRKCAQQLCAQMWAHMVSYGSCEWFVLCYFKLNYNKKKRPLPLSSELELESTRPSVLPYHDWAWCCQYKEFGGFMSLDEKFVYVVSVCSVCADEMSITTFRSYSDCFYYSSRMSLPSTFEQLVCLDEACCKNVLRDKLLFQRCVFVQLQRMMEANKNPNFPLHRFKNSCKGEVMMEKDLIRRFSRLKTSNKVLLLGESTPQNIVWNKKYLKWRACEIIRQKMEHFLPLNRPHEDSLNLSLFWAFVEHLFY